VGRLVPRTDLHLRWCARCGWQGTVRVASGRRRAARASAGRVRRGAEPARDRVDIRRLEIDGQPWKVMVQCWAEEGRWLGRLLFVGPDGRARIEEETSIEGGSALEVLSTALAIPERTLAGRLRRATH
jgi:hypothetical protein